MLQIMRNALKSWAGKVLIGLFILPFLFLGAETFFSAFTNRNYAIEINGEGVVEQQIAQSIETTKQRYRDQFGENFDLSLFSDAVLRESAVNQLIEEELLKQYVEDNNLDVSFEKLSEILRESAIFLDEDGKFSQEVFESVIAQQGLSSKQAIEIYRQRISSFQPVEAISRSSFVLENELNLIEQLKKQQRSFSYLSLDVEKFKSAIETSEEDIESYYQENLNQYRTEEMVQLEYIDIKLNNFKDKIEISDEAVLSRFEVEKATREANLKRRAAHILIEINDDTSEKEAFKTITEIEQKLSENVSFDSLAKTYSTDTSSAEKGGDLGFASKGDFEPEFEESLFSLAVGEISEPILTEFGYHLIKFSELEKSEDFTFDKEKERIQSSLEAVALDDIFQEKIAEAEDVVFESRDLQEVALATDLEVQESEFFSRTEGKGIAQHQSIRDLAFSDEILNLNESSNVVEITNNHAVVIRLKEHQPISDKPLEKVKASIIASIKSEKAKDKIADTRQAILDQIEQGKDKNELAKEYQLEWADVDNAERTTSDIPREILTQVFKMPKPKERTDDSDSDDIVESVASTNYAQSNTAIIVLSEVIDSSEMLSSDELTEVSERALRNQGNAVWKKYIEYVKEQANIKVKSE